MVMPLGDEAPTRIVPFVNFGLIALNVLVYVVQLSRPEVFTTAWAATPFEITHNVDLAGAIPVDGLSRVGDLAPRGDRDIAAVIEQAPIPIPVWLTLFSAMFMHGGTLHLAGNMLYLWIFGDNVEEVLGHRRYLIFYLICGLAASFAQIVIAPNSVIPTLGASGAIAGVMGAYVVWFPRNQVRVLLVRVVTLVPALVVIGFWIAMQVFMGLNSLRDAGQAGGVAYMAHAGGALAGVAIGFTLRPRAREFDPIDTSLGWPRQPDHLQARRW